MDQETLSGRLACAAWPEKSEDLSFLDAEIEILEGGTRRVDIGVS
jgi:hypothetical protein